MILKKMVKRRRSGSLWIISGIMLSLLSCHTDHELQIIKRGKVPYKVFCGEEESPVVRFAARELAHYLGEISGDTVVVTSDTGGERKIVVGRHNPLYEKYTPHLTGSVKADGFVIKSAGEQLYIS